MEAQGDEGTVRHRRKLVVLGTALPVASEARHSGHRLAPTGKGLPTRLPRSGLVQCRAFLAWRRGVKLVAGQEVAARDGKLKTGWTEPRVGRTANGDQHSRRLGKLGHETTSARLA